MFGWCLFVVFRDFIHPSDVVKFDAHLSCEDLGHAPMGSTNYRRSVDLESTDGPRPLRASDRYMYFTELPVTVK